MRNLEELKAELKRGDLVQLAEITGYGYEMVRKVIAGTRNNDIIIKAANDLLDHRASLAATYSKKNPAENGK